MDKKFLVDYLKTDSPSTYEVEGQKSWIKQVSKLSLDITTDNYGNAFTVLKSKSIDGDKYKVVIDAHCDEIGWVISNITDDGFIYVKRNGGTDNEITPCTRVKILTDNTDENGNTIKIKGTFGTVPIHLKNKETPTKPSEDNIYIDVLGTSKEDVLNMGIEVGNYVVFDRDPEFVNGKYIVSKSLDDKIGGFVIAEVLRDLVEKNIDLPYDLYIVNSVQEEVGLRGAKMITETIKPDVAICFDVCFDTNTPIVDKKKYGDFKMGEGVVFRSGSDVHPNMLKLMKKVAKDNAYDYKVSIGGGGGTNTYSYNLSNGGVISSTLSIPLRYMHTANEVVSLDDIQTSINYLVDLLKNIKNGHDFRLVK